MSPRTPSTSSSVTALFLALSCYACSDDGGNAPGSGGTDAAGGASGSAPAGAGPGGSANAGSGTGGKPGGSAGGGAGGSTSMAGGGGSSGSGGAGSGGAGDPAEAVAAGTAFCEKIAAEDCPSLTTLEQCKAALNRYVGKPQACLDATQAYWECAQAAPDVCNVNAACATEGDASNEICF